MVKLSTNKRGILFLLAILAVSLPAHGSLISRVKTFVDGSVLSASDLNSEFNNAVNGVNSINDANIVTSAGILPEKLSTTIAGDGIARDVNGVLSANVDASTIEINSDIIRVKDAGIVTAKIADGAVTQAKRASLNIQTSSASGFFNTTSTSFVDVTNLTVSITTTGRPVFVGLIPDDASGDSDINAAGGLISNNRMQILRGASAIAAFLVGYQSGSAGSTTVPVSTVYFIDTPSAGTYTYKLQMKSSGGSSVSSSIEGAKLTAYEL